MINRASTKIELKLEDDIYEFEEMMIAKSKGNQPVFTPFQCEVEVPVINTTCLREDKPGEFIFECSNSLEANSNELTPCNYLSGKIFSSDNKYEKGKSDN